MLHAQVHRMSVRAVAVAAALTLPVLAPAPASAHGGAEADNAVVRAMTGLVYVRSAATVRLIYIDHHHEVSLKQVTYDVESASATGFAVRGDGTIVTATRALHSDVPRSIRYAANRLFAERLGGRLASRDRYAATHVVGNADLDAHLQSCYRAQQAATNPSCVIFVVPTVSVFPYNQPASRGLPATVLRHGSSDSDIAVLRIEAAGLPTVGVASGGVRDQPVVHAIGFSAQPRGKATMPGKVPGALAKTSTVTLKSAVPRTAVGGPVVDEAGDAVGVLLSPAARAKVFVGLAPVLASLGRPAAPSPVNATLNRGLGHYASQHYGEAVTWLTDAYKRYPSALAAHYLDLSRAAEGSAADKSHAGMATEHGDMTAGTKPKKSAGVPWKAGAGGLVAVAALGTGGLLLRRRRRAAGGPRAEEVAPVTDRQSAGRTRDPAGAVPSPVPGKPPPTSRGRGAEPAGLAGATSVRPAGSTIARADPAPSATSRSRRFCTSCGNELATRHRFCGVCGSPAE